jgi:hypothetical protein
MKSKGRPRGSKDKKPRKRPAPPSFASMSLKPLSPAPKSRGLPPAPGPTKSKRSRQASAINDEDAGRQHGVKNGKGKTKVDTGVIESSLAVLNGEESGDTCTNYMPLQCNRQQAHRQGQDNVDGEYIIEGFGTLSGSADRCPVDMLYSIRATARWCARPSFRRICVSGLDRLFRQPISRFHNRGN